MFEFNLHKAFHTKGRTTDIKCNGVIEPGITTAIYGKSGIGKSTVLRMLAGLETANEGFIRFNGDYWLNTQKKINIPIAKRNVGFVFQDFNLFPNMTVERNLKYASPGNIISSNILALLEITGVSKMLSSYPADLSGGEKQRVSIIRSLCLNPEILLLDEPFSALDDDVIGDLIREISLIQQRTNTTVVMVSHRKDVIFEMASSLILMNKDDEVVQGAPADLITKRF